MGELHNIVMSTEKGLITEEQFKYLESLVLDYGSSFTYSNSFQ
jgi:hypothetical protein